MNEFFQTLTADLRDRRLLPFVSLVGIALLAAVAYAVLGGGSSAAPSTPAPLRSPAVAGISATQTTPETALAETTNGVVDQRKGKSHDPFKLLPGTEKPASTSTSTSTSTSSSSSTSSGGAGGKSESESGSGSGSGGSGGSGSGEPESKPSKPSKPGKHGSLFHVAVLFGAIPAGTPPLVAELPPYQDLKLLTPLPSAQQPLLVFRGVTAGGKSATFTLVGEAILHGQAACVPNATQCQAIDLQKERYEQFEYLAPNGEIVTYELRVVSITSRKASTASAKSLMGSESKAGRELLRNAHLLDIPLMRDATQPGVLVFDAADARAHTAAARGR